MGVISLRRRIEPSLNVEVYEVKLGDEFPGGPARRLGGGLRTASGSVGTEDQPDYRRFTVHRIDQSVASGPSFGTAEEVRAHLDDIARLPLWRLDLDDPSVEFDHTELAVKDLATGESFNLRGWGSGITGVSRSNQKAGLYGVAQHLSVRSDDAPTIGNWYKSNIS
jgi:hypothetical protein